VTNLQLILHLWKRQIWHWVKLEEYDGWESTTVEYLMRHGWTHQSCRSTQSSVPTFQITSVEWWTPHCTSPWPQTSIVISWGTLPCQSKRIFVVTFLFK
jgi:hypothetical protein